MMQFTPSKQVKMQQLFQSPLSTHSESSCIESIAPQNISQFGLPRNFGQCEYIVALSLLSVLSCHHHEEPTGIILTAAAMGIPTRPRSTLASHCIMVRGVVLANSPRNWTMMNWKMTVLVRTAMKT
jgi:hypothetical protein